MHWGGILFAALVIVLAIPFALPHLRGPDSSLGTEGAKTLLVIVVIAAASLGLVNVMDTLGGFDNRASYWTLNIALSALFWVMLLRLCWRERRQRPR